MSCMYASNYISNISVTTKQVLLSNYAVETGDVLSAQMNIRIMCVSFMDNIASGRLL